MSRLFTSSALSSSFGLLFLRIALAGSLLTHGIAKIENFSALSATFPDPFGTGHLTALLLAIFAEVVCSILVILGLWTRAALIPLICTFLTISFVVLAGKDFGAREMPLLYLFGFVTLFFTGAGKFALTGCSCPVAPKVAAQKA